MEQQAINSMQAHEVQAAEATLVEARSMLAGLLGLSSAKALVLPDAFPPFELPGLDEAELQATAAANRAEWQAATASVQQAHAEAALQTGALRNSDPALGLGGTRESGGTDLNGLALQITLPVFDTGQARKALAASKVAEAEASAEATRRRIPLEVERALATLLTAQSAAGHAEHHQMQQQQLEQLARHDYEQGVSDFFRYRQSSRARLVAAMDQVESQQVLWAAWVGLQRATGVAQAEKGGSDQVAP
jgi:outer membrane protein TolC